MTHLGSIILIAVYAVLAIALLYRVCFLYKKIKSAHKTPHPTHSPIYDDGVGVFFSHTIAGVLHTVLVLAFITMTAHSISSLLGIENELWDIIASVWAVGAIIAAMIFIMRRCFIRPMRFSTLSPSQRLDAYTILLLEIVSGATLIASIYGLQGFDTAHYITLASFAVYITYSKHLHIITAWIYRYLNRGRGVYDMERVSGVCAMMDMMEGKAASIDASTTTMGAANANELSRLDVLGVFSCTQCGRCVELCPPYLVGEEFSPMEITTRIRHSIEKGGNFYPDALDDNFISMCISCGACRAACPVGISPMKLLWEVKRYAHLEKGYMPSSYHTASQSTQNSSYPLPTYLDKR